MLHRWLEPALCNIPNHHYRLDQTFQHETISDTSGSVNATSTTVFRGSQGVIAGAFELEENDGDYLNFGPANGVIPAGDFTITAWVRFSANGGDENERLFDCSDGDAFAVMTSGFNFKMQSGLRAFVGDGTNKVATTPQGESLNQETWYLIAMRYQVSSNPGVTEDGAVILSAVAQSTGLIDANAIATLTEITPHNVGSLAVSTQLRFGTSPLAGTDATKSFDGLVDEIRIYDSVLSDAELAALHNAPVKAGGARRWIFNVDGDSEGWTGSGLNSLTAVGGNLVAEPSGNNPAITSPDQLGLELTRIEKVFVQAKNETTLTNGSIQFSTNENPAFTGNSVPFALVPSDSGSTTYEIDMSGHPNWEGTLKQLRIALSDGESGGSRVLIDRVAIGAMGNRA